MAKKEDELNFEDSLKKLETIVKDLESGSIPLDDAIKSFNEAMLIAKTCDEKLKNAEESINQTLNKETNELEDFKRE